MISLVNEKLTLKVPFKTEENIEAAVKLFADTIQQVGMQHQNTPIHPMPSIALSS
jgi:hypothetical protein